MDSSNDSIVSSGLTSLPDLVERLAPARLHFLAILESAQRNRDVASQFMFLLERCMGIFGHLNLLCLEDKIMGDSETIPEFQKTLEQVGICVENFSERSLVQRFLQRQAMSDSIMEGHELLNKFLASYASELEVMLTFPVVAAESDKARKRDEARFKKKLERLTMNRSDILDVLRLQDNQTLDAIRGLRDAISRGIDKKWQKAFAAKCLRALMELHTGGRRQRIPSYEWAISSMEIIIGRQTLGSGTFGITRTGRWNGAPVVVKRLAKKIPQRILVDDIDEIRPLNHPHLHPFYRACVESKPPLLVSKFYPLGNVMDYLSRFPDANRLNLARCHEVASGMEFLHGHCIVHGNLKPTNVLIDHEQRARITDYGLANIKVHWSLNLIVESLAKPGVMRSSVASKIYMAPERLRECTMNNATDVYSFGMTSYEIITGKRPLQQLLDDEIWEAIVTHHQRPRRPNGQEFVFRGLTTPMWELIKRCWRHDGQRRPTFSEISTNMQSLTNPPVYAKDDVLPPYNAKESRPVHGSKLDNDFKADFGLRVVIPDTNLSFVDGDFDVAYAPGFGTPLSPTKEGDRQISKRRSSFSQDSTQTASRISSGYNERSERSSWYEKITDVAGSSSTFPRRFSRQQGSASTSSKGKIVEEKLHEQEALYAKRISLRKEQDYHLKVVVVGDRGCGKTILLHTFSQGHLPQKYTPTVFENYVTDVSILGHGIELELWDTAGQEDYENLRKLSYPNAHVFLICFSIGSPDSLRHVRDKWYKEVYSSAPGIPILLIGCGQDLRMDGKTVKELEGLGMTPVTVEEAEAEAKAIGAVGYLECSALQGEGIREVFRTATAYGLGVLLREGKGKTRDRSCIIS